PAEPTRGSALPGDAGRAIPGRPPSSARGTAAIHRRLAGMTVATERTLRRIELGLAQLPVLVAVGSGEPRITVLPGTQLAVGLVKVAILVHVHLLEALGQARIGLGF